MPSTPVWPDGRLEAVSPTYDDALPCHHESVGPELEDHGLRGTFYVSISDDPIARPAAWRAVVERGHEPGNHSLFHPCRREKPEEMTWLHDAYNLCAYTERRLRDELRTADKRSAALERYVGLSSLTTDLGSQPGKADAL